MGMAICSCLTDVSYQLSFVPSLGRKGKSGYLKKVDLSFFSSALISSAVFWWLQGEGHSGGWNVQELAVEVD